MSNLSEQKHKIAEKITKNHGLRPWTTHDQKLSMEHLEDSKRYNLRHAKDHMKAVKLDEKIMAKQRKWSTPEEVKKLEKSPNTK